MLALKNNRSRTVDTAKADVSTIVDIPTGFDFQVLAPLEMVTDQFSEVSFACAIALVPSNPRFIAKPGQLVVMPTGNDNQLTIALEDTVDAFCLWGRCTQPMILKVLESNGNVLEIRSDAGCHLPETQDIQDADLLPLQILELEDMNGVAMIELSAQAPFVIEGLSI